MGDAYLNVTVRPTHRPFCHAAPITREFIRHASVSQSQVLHDIPITRYAVFYRVANMPSIQIRASHIISPRTSNAKKIGRKLHHFYIFGHDMLLYYIAYTLTLMHSVFVLDGQSVLCVGGAVVIVDMLCF